MLKSSILIVIITCLQSTSVLIQSTNKNHHITRNSKADRSSCREIGNTLINMYINQPLPEPPSLNVKSLLVCAGTTKLVSRSEKYIFAIFRSGFNSLTIAHSILTLLQLDSAPPVAGYEQCVLYSLAGSVPGAPAFEHTPVKCSSAPLRSPRCFSIMACVY